jgi:hypothetical protein
MTPGTQRRWAPLVLPTFRDGNPQDVAREIRRTCEPVMANTKVARQ